MVESRQLDLLQPDARPARTGEDGFMLLAVVVMAFLVLLALAVAAPIVAKDLRRDKEVESEHRAEQYVRAIRLYQRNCKCTAYPPSMKALEKGNNIRFLRHQFVDPLTGKADWRIIHQPQTKTHFPFGEELTGLGGGGGLGAASGLASNTGASAATPSTTVSGGSALSSGFSGATIGGSSGTPGTPGAPGSAGSDSDKGIFGDSSGGVIYGVGTSRSGDSILNPNQQTTYETWEFWYDPLIEQFYKTANVTGGGGLGSTDASKFGQDAGSFGGSGTGSGTPGGNSFGGNGNSGNGNGGNSGGSFGSGGSSGSGTGSPTSAFPSH